MWRQKHPSKALYIRVPVGHHIQVHVSQFHATSHATKAPVSVPTPNLALTHARQALYHFALPPSPILSPKVIVSVLSLSHFQFFISFYFPDLSALISLCLWTIFIFACSHLLVLHLMPHIVPLPKSCVWNNLPLVFWFSLVSLTSSRVLSSHLM